MHCRVRYLLDFDLKSRSGQVWVLYVAYCTTHQRLVEVQFGRYQKKCFEGVIYGQKSLMCKLCSLKRFPLKFTRVTHAHLGPILYHSKPSDVSYSQDQFLSWDLFHRFLQQDGSNCTIIQLLASRNSNGPSKLKCSMKESYVILKNYSYKFDCNYQDFACPLSLAESGDDFNSIPFVETWILVKTKG